MARQFTETGDEAVVTATTARRCIPCASGSHKSCSSGEQTPLRSSNHACQCACLDNGHVSGYGLATPILSKSGRIIGKLTGDGRKFAFGPAGV